MDSSHFYQNDQLESLKSVPFSYHHPILEKIGYSIEIGDVSHFEQSRIQLLNKQISLLEVLNQPEGQKIDLKALRNLAFRGIPPEMIQEYKVEGSTSQMRPLVWRILLGVLSLDTGEWEDQQKQNLETYELWKRELITNINQVRQLYEKDGNQDSFDEEYKIASSIYKTHRIAEIRNPKMKKLNQDEIFEKISKQYRTVWYNLFRDQDMMEEIQKDVRRTRQEIGFFIKPLKLNRELTEDERK